MNMQDFLTLTPPGGPQSAADQFVGCASRARRRSLVMHIPALMDYLCGIGHRATYPAEEG